MRKKYIGRKKEDKIIRFLRVPILLILFFTAIKLGTFGGNLIYNFDFKIIRNIDAGNFKATLNYSIPMIDTIYNSGNISTSVLNEFRHVIKTIFGFDLGTPLTVLNAQSSLFFDYYGTNYLPMIAKRETQSMPDIKPQDNPPEDGQDENNDKPDQQPPQDTTPNFLEDASSICFEEGDEKKDLSKGNVITNGEITVQNETKFKVDINELIKEPLNISFDKKGPKVLIYHTHTTESYIRTVADLEKKDVAVWSLNEQYNMIKVGNELAQELRKKYDIEVLHSGSIHDYPVYNSAYNNSLSTLSKYIKSYPSVKIFLDIHRDGLGENGKLRVTQEINGKTAAKIMFVVGTNGIGLDHPNWRENLKLAVKLQAKLNELYPGLARPIFISKNRYNQHVGNGALIVEIGGDGNTLTEALESTKYLARAINEVIK